MDIQTLINEPVGQLTQVSGVSAIVLGGSRARGTHTPKSDIDLCLYYDPDRPLDLKALDQVAAEFDEGNHLGLLAPIGGWGPWINSALPSQA